MRRRPLPPVREEASQHTTARWRAACESETAVYALVACVAAVVYANSLHGEFVHDDIPAIVANGDVTGANRLRVTFVNDFWGTPMWDPASHKSYRPLTTLSFRLNYAVCGLAPWWWHACNVALHAACSALVARVGAVVARLQRPFATLAALLFAVHPVHTEAVSGVVGRADLLACLFFLLSLLLYHGSCGGRGASVWWSVTLAALSTLAKETGLTVLVFNITFDIYRCWSTQHKSTAGAGARGRCWRLLAALLALAGARLALLHGSLPAFSPQDNPAAFHPSFIVRLLTFSYVAAFSWWLALCPWSLSHDWQMGSVPLVTSPLDPRNLLTGAALLALLALGYRCCADLETQRHCPAAAGTLLLVVPYLPASNLTFTVGFVVAERLLYMPSIGSVLLTAYGVQLLWRVWGGGGGGGGGAGRSVLLGAVAVLVAAGVARTHARNMDWRSREHLLRADLAVLPHNAKLHYNFGNFLKDTEQQENAIKHYQEALRLWPSYASAHNNLGTLLVASGGAEHHFLQALRYNRDHVNAHYNLGKLYRKNNRVPESVRMLERCIALQPRFVRARLELLQLTPPAERHDLLRTIVHLEPRSWDHRILYGNWLKERGLKPAAVVSYLAAMRLAFSEQSRSRDSELVTLRTACLALRDLGQRARVLQLVTRWHSSVGGSRSVTARNLHLREWRLRTELAGRARIYTRTHPHTVRVLSTCLHHSQLEVSPSAPRAQAWRHLPPATPINQFNHIRTFIYMNSDSELRNVAVTDTTFTSACQKSPSIKKSVSISTHYKPIHNKSETGHKQKSCPPLKQNEMKEPEDLTPYISDHLIKTY